MQRSKRAPAVFALAISVGLILPGALGAPVAADVTERNPQYVETVFECDRDEIDGYEARYELVSTFSARMWQDKNSTTVIVQRLRVDVLDSFYTPLPPENLGDPVGVYFEDPDVYWFDGPQDYSQGGGKPKGWKTVRCTEVVSYEYTATAEDAALGIGFVEGARYTETDTNLYDVTISGDENGKVKAAGGDDKASAERQQKSKKSGNHRGKGKRGR